MQTVTLRYTESDPELGTPGWNVIRRGKHYLDISEIYASESSKLLAHDILEHWDFRQRNMNLQELVALGSILAHREGDFTNHYTGDSWFSYEIAAQLYYSKSNGNYNVKLPRSSSSCVKKTLDEAWQDVLKSLKSEFEYTPTNSRKLRCIAYRFISRGYNHVKEINKRCDSQYRFNAVFDDVKYVLEQGLKRVDKSAGCEVRLNYSFTTCKVELFQSLGFEDDQGYLKTMFEHLASNQQEN